MQKVNIESFKVIGIGITTTNANGQSGQDIGQLWGRFMAEGIADRIPKKLDKNIFSIYTNYQGDHTMPYDTIIGCKVDSLENIPEGMVGEAFDGGTYTKVVAKGDLTKGLVYETWKDIFEMNLNREFKADFELYGEKAQNPENAEVEVFVGVRD